jgi:Uri superfamily endonuclease
VDSRPISVTPFAPQNLTSEPGCYSLIINLKQKKKIRVGKLGVALFPKGTYVYTGSAMNGLGARLRRHMSRKKKLHWHIDYLLALPEARIEKILCYPPAPDQECRQNQRIAALPGALVILKNFGASDCKSSCSSHLFFFSKDFAPPVVGSSVACDRLGFQIARLFAERLTRIKKQSEKRPEFAGRGAPYS